MKGVVMRRIGLLFAIALLLVACQPLVFGQPDVVIAVLSNPSTPVVGACSITVLLHDAGGKPIQGASVIVEGTATFPHTAPIQSSAVERKPGVYAASLVWPQAGSWIVIVRATLASGETVQRQVDLPYVQAR